MQWASLKSLRKIIFNCLLTGDFVEQFKILAFAGSLRKGSYNKALVRTALEVAPENIFIEIFDLEGIPPFNNDNINNPPAHVIEFKEKIRSSDALLIASPEYNYSIPGVLKNAIDWASNLPKEIRSKTNL